MYAKCRTAGGGRPGLPVANSPYGLCGRKATLNLNKRNRRTRGRRGGDWPPMSVTDPWHCPDRDCCRIDSTQNVIMQWLRIWIRHYLNHWIVMICGADHDNVSDWPATQCLSLRAGGAAESVSSSRHGPAPTEWRLWFLVVLLLVFSSLALKLLIVDKLQWCWRWQLCYCYGMPRPRIISMHDLWFVHVAFVGRDTIVSTHHIFLCESYPSWIWWRRWCSPP